MDKQIKNYLDNPKKEYKIINGIHIPDNIKLPKTTLAYSHYGNFKNMEDLHQFLEILGDNSLEDINNLEETIKKITKNVLAGFQKKDFWLNIRITYKDPSFNISRWHSDGKFFPEKNDKDFQANFIMTLQGEGTLLIKDNKKVIKKFIEIEESTKPFKYGTSEWEKENLRVRKLFNKEMKKTDIVQLNNNQGLIFIAYPGNKFLRGAIHSEPKKNTFRMFLKIVPGTKEDIANRFEKYKELYMKEKHDWQQFKL